MEHQDLQSIKRGLDNIEMLEKASKVLYECTILQMVHDLHTLKASNWCSNTSFNELLEFLAKLLPKSNNFPTTIYPAKKLLSSLALGIQKNTCLPKPFYLVPQITRWETSVQHATRVVTRKIMTMMMMVSRIMVKTL
jgi:hypothetical protein